ncbi:hypothetical protein NQ314_016802 [Rhamnusium bicolor]|uniref:DUF4371 domain-containing protein n=1 Tax=Rhamnusium bicolor TaxID=1586634 RepID=A0AAV8WUY9_9CUCU|nr:hypothetical protein NQ314_016802 [Rhamnusium bicolor]
MADGRKKLSGSEYRKRALDKSKKEQEVLSKTPKLDDFFTKTEHITHKSKFSNRDCTNLDHEGDDACSTSTSKQTPSTSNNTDSTTTSSLPQNIHHESELQATIPTINIEDNEHGDIVISDDPGEWVINDFTRDYVATHGCKQNVNLNFSSTKRDYSDGTSRWLSESLFVRKLINAEDLLVAVLSILEFFDLDLADCRSQSYDNVNNVSGIYSGLQARIHEINDLAEHAPCAAHSMNLVGVHAVECAPEAASFFNTKKKLHADESRDGDVQLSGRDHFRVNTFNVILDKLDSELRKRCVAYEKIQEKFSVIIEFGNLDNREIRKRAKRLKNFYSSDLESSLDDEFVHFHAYCTEKKMEQNSPSDILKLLRPFQHLFLGMGKSKKVKRRHSPDASSSEDSVDPKLLIKRIKKLERDEKAPVNAALRHEYERDRGRVSHEQSRSLDPDRFFVESADVGSMVSARSQQRSQSPEPRVIIDDACCVAPEVGASQQSDALLIHNDIELPETELPVEIQHILGHNPEKTGTTGFSLHAHLVTVWRHIL